MKGLIISLAGGYALVDTDKYRLDVLAGTRFFYMDVDLDFQIGRFRESFDRSGNNWNGIIGVKGQAELSDQWYLNYYLDAGTGENKFSWQALGGFGYRFQELDAIFGYRHMHYDFDKGDSGGDVFDHLYFTGPFAGIKLRF